MKKLLFITLSLCTILLCSAAPDNWDNRKDPIVGSIRLQKCNQTDVVVEVLGHLKEVGLTQTTLKAEILLQGRRPDGIYEDIGKRYVTLKQVTHGKDDNNIKRLRWGWFHEYRVTFENTDGKYTEFAAVIIETDGKGKNRKFYSWFGLYGYTKKKSLPNMDLITVNNSTDQNHQISTAENTTISLKNIDYCGCADVFFSLQKINKWWSPLDQDKKSWFSRPVLSNGGSCNSNGSSNKIVKTIYTLKEISEMLGIEIEPNTYYRLKIALGVGPWNAINKIFYTGEGTDLFTTASAKQANTQLDSSVILNPSAEAQDDLLKTTNIKLYPNPTEGLFTIGLNSISDATSNVQVYSINGVLVYNKHFDQTENSSLQINLEEQPKGLYIVQLTHNNQVTTHKLVKK